MATYSLSCTTRDFYVTGRSVDLLYHRIMSLLHTSYTLHVLDATLSLERQALDSGFFVAIGNPANLEYHRLLNPDLATYTLTGQDANLVLAIGLLSAESGTVSLTGQTADLRHLLFYSLLCEYGMVTIDGSDILATYYKHLFATNIAEFIIDVYTN